MRQVRYLVVAIALTLAARLAAAQATVYCMPEAPACFSATWGFIPLSATMNRISVDITNLESGATTPFAFKGFRFFKVNINDVFSANGLFREPTPQGAVRVNPTPFTIRDLDQPVGPQGGRFILSSFHVGCTVGLDWTFSTCLLTGFDGFIRWDIDLFGVNNFGPTRPLTFDDFALVAVTSAGECTLTPSSWYLSRPGATPACVAVTPEPATMLLVASGLGLAGLLGWRRRNA